MWKAILSWLFSGPLDRAFQTVDNAVNNETTREQVKADIAKSYLTAQATILTGRGWWFPLFFLLPAGLWFATVCIYSMLFCRGCIWPYAGLGYPWSIAALPPPLDSWMGVIVGSLFVTKGLSDVYARLKK